MAICILNHGQVEQWMLSGVRPPCQHHHHISFRKAQQSVNDDEAYWIPQLRAIVIYTCVQRYVWTGRRSAGYSAMQLTTLRGRKGPLGLCEAARRNSV